MDNENVKQLPPSNKFSFNILQINIEGWTSPKKEILQKIAIEKNLMVMLVQETHQNNPQNLKLSGFVRANHIPHAHHGIVTFVRNSISFTNTGCSVENSPTQWTSIEINNTQIINIYHPPTAELDTLQLPDTKPTCIISGDFNCRHKIWGYSNSDKNGVRLANWYSLNNLHNLYDPKQSPTFFSGRWKKGTNPDLTLCSNADGAIPIREVLNPFPRSQHRPSLIFTPPILPFVKSRPMPRWNFPKADWDKFRLLTDKCADNLPTPTKDNLNLAYSEFTTLLKAAAKDSIPRGYRKSYIPNWDTECEKRYKTYLQSEGTSKQQKYATALFDYLDSKRHEQWIDTITSIDFTHSSRKACRTLNKITGRKTTPKKCPVPPNQLAKQLQDNGRYPNTNRKFTKAILKESDELKNKNTHSDHHHLENDITTLEVSSAIKSLKLGKAPGPDGIHNEFIKNCGTKLVHWLNEFLNICYRHIRIPKQWRHANVISILKPGKPETSPRSYRPISLLCTTYKLLERILLTRIEPIIDKLLPKEQAGFRKGRSTVDQVAKLTPTIEDAFDKKEIMGSVFIDLTAAYDTVWHQGLRVKFNECLPLTT